MPRLTPENRKRTSTRDGTTIRPLPRKEPCGYCSGTGRTPGPRYDRDGRRRDDWPETVCCQYCDGTGSLKDGRKLLPARRPTKD